MKEEQDAILLDILAKQVQKQIIEIQYLESLLKRSWERLDGDSCLAVEIRQRLTEDCFK